jgi:hypothetical protein
MQIGPFPKVGKSHILRLSPIKLGGALCERDKKDTGPNGVLLMEAFLRRGGRGPDFLSGQRAGNVGDVCQVVVGGGFQFPTVRNTVRQKIIGSNLEFVRCCGLPNGRHRRVMKTNAV